MAQSLARLWTHLIFSTKDRHPFLSDLTIRNDAWSDAIPSFIGTLDMARFRSVNHMSSLCSVISQAKSNTPAEDISR